MLYTAQYRYKGPDRLDITVKSATGMGAVFAPTWDMVNSYKARAKDLVAWDQTYYVQYEKLLRDRYYCGGAWAFERLDYLARTGDVTVVCFCAPGHFCHRELLCRILTKTWRWTTPWGGERRF